jgi:carboxyl-terminal processing protease
VGKKLTNALLLVLTSLIWLLIGWTLHSQLGEHVRVAQNAATVQIDKARTLIQNRQFLTHEITAEQLSIAAIRGMVAETHDSYAVLFTPPASAAYGLDIAGDIGAPGIWKTVVDGKIVISRLDPKGGAERAGLQVGDILLGVNGIQFDETTSLDEASVLLRGPVDTTAKIVIERAQAILEYEVPRDAWTILTSQVISDQIGYIQQTLFHLNADKKMQQHLQLLLDQKVEALIWDLRDNRGGSIQATETILNNFIREGVFYQAEFKDGQRQMFSANGSAKVVDLPLVVLVNEKTNSAGEIAAAALADNQRAVLIGTPTEGKGTIQDTIALDEQYLLRITIAKWLPPSGVWIQGKGVTPTIEVTDDPATERDEVLDFAIQYIQQKFLTP